MRKRPLTYWFQSHNGAIAAIFSLDSEVAYIQFQSHNGAIAAQGVAWGESSRAKVSIPQWCDCCENRVFVIGGKKKFQSHNGAIAALSVTQQKHRITESFNPTMVRLLQIRNLLPFSPPKEFQSHNGAIAASISITLSLSLTRVSIPQWCDCCVHCLFAQMRSQ